MTTFLNRVMMPTATTGTGTLTLSTASTNATLGDFFTLLEAGSIDGETVSYTLWEGHNVEMGVGTIGGTGTTLTRTVTASKISGTAGTTKITLGGTGTVMLSPLAADLAGGGSATVTVPVTSAQLKNIGSVPPVLIAAPGAGKAIIVETGTIVYSFGTAGYDGTSAPSITLGYSGQNINLSVGQSAATVDPYAESQVALGILFLSTTASSSIGNTAIVLKEANGHNLTTGPVATTSLGAGGLGYAPGDTGVVNVDDQDATYVVDTVGGGGAVLTYHLDNAGTGYEVQSGAATQVSTGAGDGNFTINILSVTQGDGTVSVILTYHVVTL